MNVLLIAVMMMLGGQQEQPRQNITICGGELSICQGQALMQFPTESGGVVIVPAVKITVPASRPCNLAPGGDRYGNVFALCLTGPETHTTCEDKRRVLLTSEDGQSFCLRLDLIGEKR